MRLREHTLLGTTQSLCPECLTVVPAKIIARRGRVYFRKHCPTHGTREDFVCSDIAWFDRDELNTPGRVPEEFSTETERGCPYDCGLCPEHEQHTCVGLVEINSACNLACPTCYSSSGPGGTHLSVAECRAAIDRLVRVEGRAEILQLSGGEPTIHPEFLDIFDYACAQPIDYVLINTNGIRLARDGALVKRIAARKDRAEVYLQFDGFDDDASVHLRGESLVETKLRAIDALGKEGIHVTLVATLEAGVNDDQVGAIVRFALERPWVTGVSFQPTTYSGRHVLPETLERRVTFPDVVKGIVEQTGGLFRPEDFLPLPCAHPNCHTLAYAFRWRGSAVPLTRFVDAAGSLDLLANGITFTRPKLQKLIEQYLGKLAACGPECGCWPASTGAAEPNPAAAAGLTVLGAADPLAEPRAEFFRRSLAGELFSEDVFRITITSFLDAYNFDLRRLMKCCIHHVLPSGQVIPFCAYNVLYRPGHVPLPPLARNIVPVGALAARR